jgi:cytochrome c-type biogenesis protein CcmF
MRNQRRYGGYIIHLGVVMIALGVIGDAYFKEEVQGTLSVGETLKLGSYTLQFDGLRSYPGSDGREVVEATTSLYKGGQLIRVVQPRRDFFVVQEQPVTVPGVYSTFGEDVYALLLGWEGTESTRATFRIYLNPLINWIWIGGMVLILGILVAAWPTREGSFRSSYVLKPSLVPDGLQARLDTGD